MKKILFLHGFFASGHCVLANTLHKEMEPDTIVLSPDLPLQPQTALQVITKICHAEHPCLLVGNSCGAFYAQIVCTQLGIPALLGNPHFQMTQFLRERIGDHQYKSPREDGQQFFSINQQLIEDFELLENTQFEAATTIQRDKVWGLFGTQDTLAHFESLFLNYYTHSFHFPGGHTPTEEEVKLWYVPLIKKLMNKYPIS